MNIGEMEARFAWGVVLITDEESTDQIPAWRSDEPVTSTSTAIVVRVIHGQEASCHVRIWMDEADVPGALVFSGLLQISSGRIRVGDATGAQVIRLELPPDTYHASVLLNRVVNASRLDLVMTSRDPG